MSILFKLFGFTGLPQWAIELGALALVAGAAVGAFALYHHHVYTAGIAAQQAADQRASAKVIAAAQAQTRIIAARAAHAEATYHAEIQSVRTRARHNPIGTVRLCGNATASRGHVPEARAAQPGAARAGAGAGNLQPLPAGNPALRAGRPHNIGPLLNALGLAADRCLAVAREWQARHAQVTP